jgi:hypothetical protein
MQAPGPGIGKPSVSQLSDYVVEEERGVACCVSARFIDHER